MADPDQLCDFLAREYEVKITRKGKDYLSMKFPGAEKAKRFRRPLYRADADYRKIVIQARDSGQEQRLSTSEYQPAQDALQQLVEERRQFKRLQAKRAAASFSVPPAHSWILTASFTSFHITIYCLPRNDSIAL